MKSGRRSSRPQRLEFEVDHVVNVEAFVNQNDVAANNDVTMMGWARRKPVEEISRDRVNVVTKVIVEHDADLQTGFQFRRQPVAFAETFWKTIVMLVEPGLSGLPILVLEAWMVSVVIALLGQGIAGNHREAQEEQSNQRNQR